MARIPSLTALRAFECVARHESFTKAAEELCVTIPAVSHQIKALENELGQALFIRSHRSIELTDLGRKLFSTTSEAFLSVENTWRELKANPKPFKLSAGYHFMSNWLVSRSAKLQKTLGDVPIDHITTFEHLNFDKGEVDLAIRNGNEVVRGFHSETIYQEWWTPMCSPELAQKLRKPSDVANFQIIEARHPREPKGHPSLIDWLLANGVTTSPHDIRIIPHTETAMQMAVEGAAIKLCSSVLSGEFLKRGELVAPFKSAIRRKGIRFYMVCRAGEEHQQPISKLREFLSSEFVEMDKVMGFSDMSLFELPKTDPD